MSELKSAEFEAKKLRVQERMAEYLTAKGFNLNKPFKCLSGKHEDRHPSMSYDKKHHRVRCFACGAVYDIFDLIGLEYGLTETRDQMRKAFELFGEKFSNNENGNQNQYKSERKMMSAPINPITPKEDQKVSVVEPQTDYTQFFAECHARAGETDYFAYRGLTKETVDRFNLGFVVCKEKNVEPEGFIEWRSIVIPTSSTSYTKRNTDKNASGRDRVRKQGRQAPFNLQAFDTADGRPVFVVEGELDAISIEQMGYPAVGLGGTSGRKEFIKWAKVHRPNNAILIASDNDKVGDETAEEIHKALDGLGLTVKRVFPFGESKDANEALLRDPFDLANALEDLSKEAGTVADKYQAEHGADYLLDDFHTEVVSRAMPAVSTGFKGLDYVFDGGFYEGLYIVGAVSSGGKTTYVTQLVSSIARAGRDVLYFSLEMGKFELIAKILSRETAIKAMAKGNTMLARSNRDLMRADRYQQYSEEQHKTINEAKATFKEYANRLYIVEGLGTVSIETIKQMTERHITITGRYPIVVVDYLQIISPCDPRATDKQNVDRTVVELKRLSRDLKSPVLAISSFNRDAYNKQASMASAKESGAIEYGCDVLLALQPKAITGGDYNEQNEKRKTPREMELVVLKNRNGRTGDRIDYNYYPQFNLFIEDAEAVDKIKSQ